MRFKWNPTEREFLDAQIWAVLATSKIDGSPQQSLVGYAADDNGRLIISIKSYTAKWHNVIRQPNVCLTITNDRTQLVIYGKAEPIKNDPLRAKLTADVFASLSNSAVPELDALTKMLDEQQRTILRITPRKTFFHA